MFSIIVCSSLAERSAAITRHYEGLFGGCSHEIILIRDARSLCEGYARGVARSRGELLVFSHDDIEFVATDAPDRLGAHLARFDMVGVAGTTRLIDGLWTSAGDPYCFALVVYPADEDRFEVKCVGAGEVCVPFVQALDGCFFACRREVAEAVGFDEETFDGFHLYDMDFTLRAYQKGFRLAVCRDLPLIHASRGTTNEAWLEYRLRFEEKHRRQLLRGAPGKVREVRAIVPRSKLAWFCEPEGIRQMLAKLSVGPPGQQ